MTEHHVFRLHLDASDIIRSFNREWEQFAIENGAPELPRQVLGRPIWDYVIGSTVIQVYQHLFSGVRMTGKPTTIPFRCDSPTMKRSMEMTITREEGSGLEVASRVVTTELQPQTMFLDGWISPKEETVAMCAWCKNIRLPSKEWVETAVAVRSLGILEQSSPPGFSHTMCPDCLKTYLPT